MRFNFGLMEAINLSDQEIRLKCLEIAVMTGFPNYTDMHILRSEIYFKYVKDGSMYSYHDKRILAGAVLDSAFEQRKKEIDKPKSSSDDSEPLKSNIEPSKSFLSRIFSRFRTE